VERPGPWELPNTRLALSHQAGLIFFHHFVTAITSAETMVQHTDAYKNFGAAL
jgi:hypothetical protein